MIQVTGLTNDGRTVTILRGRAPPGLIRGAVLPVVAGSFVTLAEWDPIAKDNLFRVPDGSVGGDEGRGEVPNVLVGFGMTCNGLGQWEGFQRCVPKMCVAASGGSLESPTFSLVSPGQLHSRSCPVGYDITCLLRVIALRLRVVLATHSQPDAVMCSSIQACMIGFACKRWHLPTTRVFVYIRALTGTR